MQLAIQNRVLRWFLLAAEMGAFLAIATWIVKAYLAKVADKKGTAENLQRAIRLDSNNAEYHRRLGRMYEYVPEHYQPEKALEEFRTAVRLSPYNPKAWLNLGGALEFRGETAEAEKCLQRADFLAPNLPDIQWPVANFYLLHGNVNETFRHFRVVLGGTRNYDQAIYSTVWKATTDSNEILREVIPDDLAAEFSYLNYLTGHKQFAETKPLWKRILDRRETFDPRQVAYFIDSLIDAQLSQQAFGVWSDLQRKGIIQAPRPEDPNLVFDEDFEEEPLNMGFGWRVVPVEGVYAGRDVSTYRSPSHALLVQFPGKENCDYGHVFQFVKVSPDRTYRLQAYMKTEGITTDSGPHLEVRDPFTVAALDKLTENMTGTTSGWTSVNLDFTSGPKTELIQILLRRVPSQKLDNLISGKVWIDDVRLVPFP